jgi:hypothetical protein
MTNELNTDTIDRGAPFAVQMNPLNGCLQVFIRSNAERVSLPIEKDTFLNDGRIEWSKDYALSSFTRKQVYTGLNKAVQNARADGVSECGRELPTVKDDVTALTALRTSYRVTKGDNAGKVVSLLLHGLAAHRRAIKREAGRASLEAAVTEGVAYIAEGLVDKDGKPRFFDSRVKAAKAWVRANHPDKENWWQDKESKGVWLIKGDAKVSLLTTE